MGQGEDPQYHRHGRLDLDAKPVGESKLGDAFLALLLIPGVAVTGGVLVAGVVLTYREHTLGSREMFTVALGLVLFPILLRAFYVVAARLFNRRIEPLVPWWLAAPMGVLFTGGVVAALALGYHVDVSSAAGALGFFCFCPVVLYRQQHRPKPPG